VFSWACFPASARRASPASALPRPPDPTDRADPQVNPAATIPLPPGEPGLPLKKALLGFALWTGIALLFGFQFYLASSLSGRPIAWSEALSHALFDWYLWAALSLPALHLCRRRPIERLEWSNPVAAHLLASLLAAFLYTLARAAIGQLQSRLVGDPVAYVDIFRPLFIKSFHFNVLIYWIIVAVVHAAAYYRKYHERERRALELERRLAQARLQALRMQLNPHFLFNAMHSVSALMRQDVEAADRMLVRLSDLLRLTLEIGDAQVIPLEDELALLERYLDIERVRLGDRLSAAIDVEPAVRDIPVPCLLLQPIVENAIKHGIAPKARPGSLAVSGRLVEDGRQLLLEVSDDGGGLPGGAPGGSGVGLSNTRARLEQLYGENAAFRIENRPEGGACVRIALPAEGPEEAKADARLPQRH